jgi:hypothetical protein
MSWAIECETRHPTIELGLFANAPIWRQTFTASSDSAGRWSNSSIFTTSLSSIGSKPTSPLQIGSRSPTTICTLEHPAGSRRDHVGHRHRLGAAAAVNDFRFDLAWTLLLMEMNCDAATMVDTIAAYENHSGQRGEGLEFFVVAASVRRLLDITISLSNGAEGMGMRPEAADEMRKHSSSLAIPLQTIHRVTGIRLPTSRRFSMPYPALCDAR